MLFIHITILQVTFRNLMNPVTRRDIAVTMIITVAKIGHVHNRNHGNGHGNATSRNGETNFVTSRHASVLSRHVCMTETLLSL